MFTDLRRRRQLARIKPGDGSPLPPFRLWQLPSRTLFHVDLADSSGERHRFEVDVRYGADGTTRRSPASLYRDGLQVARSTLPARFPVPGGHVEVAVSQYGLKRMHHVSAEGAEHLLTPHPRTPEGLRARFTTRFPRVSGAIGVVAVVAFLLVAAVGLLQGIDALTHSPAVAARVGVFTTPLPLSTGWKTALGVVGALAATERALTFRSRWLVGRRRA